MGVVGETCRGSVQTHLRGSQGCWDPGGGGGGSAGDPEVQVRAAGGHCDVEVVVVLVGVWCGGRCCAVSPA